MSCVYASVFIVLWSQKTQSFQICVHHMTEWCHMTVWQYRYQLKLQIDHKFKSFTISQQVRHEWDSVCFAVLLFHFNWKRIAKRCGKRFKPVSIFVPSIYKVLINLSSVFPIINVVLNVSIHVNQSVSVDSVEWSGRKVRVTNIILYPCESRNYTIVSLISVDIRVVAYRLHFW